MNILLLAYSDSVFTRDFCEQVLNKENINTVILTPASTKQYRQDYVDNHVKEIEWPDFFLKGIGKNLSALPLLMKEWNSLKEKIGFGDQIDALHIHYVEPLHILYFFPFWRRARKRVLTFWGSDLLRASKQKLWIFPFFLKQSTSIVLMIQNQCNYFHEVFGHKYDDKLHIIDFGNSLLNVIDDVIQNYTVEECKKHFNLPLDKLIVHIGYNAFRDQQHLKILENIALLSKDMMQKLKLIFHISYGQENDFDDYKQQMVEIMDAAQMDYVFIDTYLQGEELAMFRRTCDLFVYGQKTDARSASPLEYIYAGAEFVCPGWLAGNYELLDQAGIRYYSYDDFGELDKAIQLCLEKIDSPEGKISDRERKAIRDEISWDSLAEKWRALYE